MELCMLHPRVIMKHEQTLLLLGQTHVPSSSHPLGRSYPAVHFWVITLSNDVIVDHILNAADAAYFYYQLQPVCFLGQEVRRLPGLALPDVFLELGEPLQGRKGDSFFDTIPKFHCDAPIGDVGVNAPPRFRNTQDLSWSLSRRRRPPPMTGGKYVGRRLDALKVCPRGHLRVCQPNSRGFNTAAYQIKQPALEVDHIAHFVCLRKV